MLSASLITPLRKQLLLFAVLLLCLLLSLDACSRDGSMPAADTSNTTTAATPIATASQQDGTGGAYGYGNGKYGSNGSSVSTPAAAASGLAQKVSIDNASDGFGFSPAILTVPVGTTVIWTNATSAPHTVTSDDGKTFDSGITTQIAPGGIFTFTFKAAGSFAYHCQIHPSMKATIIVK